MYSLVLIMSPTMINRLSLPNYTEQELTNLFCKGPEKKCFRFAGRSISVTTSQLCHCWVKATDMHEKIGHVVF